MFQVRLCWSQVLLPVAGSQEACLFPPSHFKGTPRSAAVIVSETCPPLKDVHTHFRDREGTPLFSKGNVLRKNEGEWFESGFAYTAHSKSRVGCAGTKFTRPTLKICVHCGWMFSVLSQGR